MNTEREAYFAEVRRAWEAMWDHFKDCHQCYAQWSIEHNDWVKRSDPLTNAAEIALLESRLTVLRLDHRE